MKLTLARAITSIAATAAALSLTAVHAQDKPRVAMKTSLGTVVIELDSAAAPKSVANFLEYVKAGYYEGTIFHRVIKGFMAQGGGFDRAMKQKETRAAIQNESEAAEKAGLKNDRGTIAMARTGDPHSATAQFYINYKDNAMLNASQAKNNVPPACKAENAPPQCKQFGWGYTAFGRVVQGMEIVDKMAEVPTGAGGMFPTDVPQTQIVIEKVTLELCARSCDSSEAAVLPAQNGSSAQRTTADDSLKVNSREDVIRTTPIAGQTRTKCTATSPSMGPVGGDEAHEFFGDCDTGGGAITGLVISAYKGVAVYPRCLNNRQYSNQIGEFDACLRAWARLPRYCSVGTYKGECENGVPNGVGVDHKITYSRTEIGGAWGMFSGMARPQEAHEIARGMFKDGKLDGFGNFFSISGCGMAGCSGGRVNQTGWFEKGQLRFECASAQACAAKVSGTAFTSRFKPSSNTVATTQTSTNQPAATTFAEAISRFERSGDIGDLKSARALARSPAELATLEFNILRTAGYEQGLTLTVRLAQGNRSVEVGDSERLMGFYRSVDSRLPLKLLWKITPNPAATALRFGTYRVNLRLGVVVKTTTRTCLGNACNSSVNTQTVDRNVQASLRASSGYSANGEVALTASGAGTSVMFGAASLTDVNSLEPVAAIESVELVR